MASGTAVRMEKDAGRVVVDGGDVRLSFARDKHHGVRKQDQTYTVELIVKEVDSSIDALQHLLETLLRATEALKNKRKTVKSGNVETLLSLFKTALETEPPEKGLRGLVEEERLAQARANLVEEGWLTAREIAQLAGFSALNPSAQPSKWKRAGRIFSVYKKGVGEVFPRYALDENLRPLPVMKAILDILTEVKTPWGMAEWFATSNDLLAGRMPQEMLLRYPANVIQAAEAEAGRMRDGAE
ncbi:hypothetical protein CIG40_24140 [Klebsiella pneumoniae]|mgnify:FL=1|jgi:histone H3/H4|uniref:DUF2384 domain-containing protein n=2 Tax=Klebsiella/Raoultella group TaxID=2890311 RepID=A0AAW9UUJ4_KLEPN|nr:hypothetical protein [Klebsiella pneumoniae]VED58042.1 Uncharacterised protein [Klebsiella aerogenes]BAH61448.1 hypothetical protein KP1_0587 [Klebsiella pneumoniae subsp. pneumoniae NTUH-K2044]HDT2750827.1 hypothetical protein [Klebsiella pneumoniae subsp. ozaenae]AMA28505.1 hypothetical protein RJF9_02865 [Klebsiella pneumoniae subsp. pneumoniae]AOE24431.1 hypothetical protein BCV48_02865 [Klebsiella pneumoniae]